MYSESILELPDGGFLVSTPTGLWVTGFERDTKNHLILRLDNEGNVIWKRSWGTLYYDFPLQIFPGRKGEFLVAGSVMGFIDSRGVIRI